MIVEILYFDGCPNYASARALVERVSDELGLRTEIQMVEILDPETAERLRFLGSPTIRVDGRDVEPGAETLEHFTLACRVYRNGSALSGLPDERWLRQALTSAAGSS